MYQYLDRHILPVAALSQSFNCCLPCSHTSIQWTERPLWSPKCSFPKPSLSHGSPLSPMLVLCCPSSSGLTGGGCEPHSSYLACQVHLINLSLELPLVFQTDGLMFIKHLPDHCHVILRTTLWEMLSSLLSWGHHPGSTEETII